MLPTIAILKNLSISIQFINNLRDNIFHQCVKLFKLSIRYNSVIIFFHIEDKFNIDDIIEY